MDRPAVARVPRARTMESDLDQELTELLELNSQNIAALRTSVRELTNTE